MPPPPLVIENPQPLPPIPPSPVSFRTVEIRSYIAKRRCWLSIAVILVLIAMIIGIIFAAHEYYVSFGGQGFLKAREKSLELPTIFLPLRSIQLEGKERARGNVPYYTCGDQQHSCEAFNQPNVCCPVKTFCHATDLSLSGIFCCNATSPSDCRISKANPPKCLENTLQCSAETGGACCEQGTICTPNGCIRITAPSIINDESISRPTSIPEALTPSTSITEVNVATETANIIVKTIIERPAATFTRVKQGEVAQNGVSRQIPDLSGLTCSNPLALVVFMVLVVDFL